MFEEYSEEVREVQRIAAVGFELGHELESPTATLHTTRSFVTPIWGCSGYGRFSVYSAYIWQSSYRENFVQQS